MSLTFTCASSPNGSWAAVGEGAAGLEGGVLAGNARNGGGEAAAGGAQGEGGRIGGVSLKKVKLSRGSTVHSGQVPCDFEEEHGPMHACVLSSLPQPDLRALAAAGHRLPRPPTILLHRRRRRLIIPNASGPTLCWKLVRRYLRSPAERHTEEEEEEEKPPI